MSCFLIATQKKFLYKNNKNILYIFLLSLGVPFKANCISFNMNNSDKFWNIIDNADSFSVRVKSNNTDFGWAGMVNLAFAVELYLKAIIVAETNNLDKIKTHNLKALFTKNLGNKTQSTIINYWIKLAGTNISNNQETKVWFLDNLYACCNVFEKFRYAHELEHTTYGTRLDSSWDDDQFKQLSVFSNSREFGKFPVYDNFLNEFESAIKQYIREQVIPKVQSRSNDMMTNATITSTITRTDGSTHTENHQVIAPMNVYYAEPPIIDPVQVLRVMHKNMNIGRNDVCSCGSGKKYKNCCQQQSSVK